MKLKFNAEPRNTASEGIILSNDAMDELAKNTPEESREKVMRAMMFRNDIRQKLLGSPEIDLEEPELPKDIESFMDMLNLAKEETNEKWQKILGVFMEQACSRWQEELEIIKAKKEGVLNESKDNKGEEEETDTALEDELEAIENVLEILGDQTNFFKRIAVQKFGDLDSLMDIAPEIYHELLILSSERRLAEETVFEKWSRDLSDEKALELGISKPELEVLCKLMYSLGKYTDTGIMKQIEISAMPGGKEKGFLDNKGQAEKYLYDQKDGDEKSIYSLIEVYQDEMSKMSRNLIIVNEDVKRKLKNKELPPEYADFSSVLEKMAQVFSSLEKDPEKLAEEWHELTELIGRSAKNGAKITVIPPLMASIMGEYAKADFEIRLGVRLAEQAEAENKLRQWIKAVHDVNATKYKDHLAETPPDPLPIVNIQTHAYGPNISFLTTAQIQPEEKIMVLHENQVLKYAKEEIGYLKKIFPQFTKINEKELTEALFTDTGLHEVGHNVMSFVDARVKERIGVGTEGEEVIEELKAESSGMYILLQSYEKIPAEMAKKQFLAKVATNLRQFTIGESPYYWAASVIVDKLFEKKIIQETNGDYIIDESRFEDGIKIISDIWDDENGGGECRFYQGDSSPDDLSKHISDIKKQARNSSNLRLLIERLTVSD